MIGSPIPSANLQADQAAYWGDRRDRSGGLRALGDDDVFRDPVHGRSESSANTGNSRVAMAAGESRAAATSRTSSSAARRAEGSDHAPERGEMAAHRALH
jgi:hypothetical protein